MKKSPCWDFFSWGEIWYKYYERLVMAMGSIIYFSPRVLRISRLTGKTGLVDRQDMGSIPVVLNI